MRRGGLTGEGHAIALLSPPKAVWYDDLKVVLKEARNEWHGISEWT